jgi:uncharacterized protein (DUF1015 family)
MADIVPFEGIYYSPELPLEQVIAPPYDVLSPRQQADLYEKHQQNIVRLILNQETADDTPENNRYTRAAAFLQESLAQGLFLKEGQPALYEYIQQFEHPHNPTQLIQRRALFVALKLEPYEKGVVLPHEETHPKAKADRLNLMRATSANPEPIYGLYEDPTLTVAQSLDSAREGQEPLLRATFAGQSAPDSEQHLLYRHTDSCLIAELQEFFASRRVWIADGHHRYETGLNYQKERREAEGDPTEPQPYDYLLIGLSAFEDPGLVVLPTHRLVKNISESRIEELPLLLERFFNVEIMTHEVGRTWILNQSENIKRFLMVLPGRAYGLTLRSLDLLQGMSGEHCEAWRHLDVSILQEFVLDRTLGISWQTLAHTPDVAYTRDTDEAFDKVTSGEWQLSCLLQNPTVTEVRDVASAGDKMPQKSTFFYPKLWSGLVLRSL